MMYTSWVGGVGFVPGEAVGMVGDHTIAMIVADPRSDLVKQLWDGVLQGATLDELADQLTRVGLRSLPALAVAQLDGQGCRLIVRGDLVVTLRRPDSPVDTILDASTVTTWVEHAEPELDRLEIHLAGDLSEAGAFLLDRGIVPASRLLWSLSPDGWTGGASGAELVEPPRAQGADPFAPVGQPGNGQIGPAPIEISVPVVDPAVDSVVDPAVDSVVDPVVDSAGALSLLDPSDDVDAAEAVLVEDSVDDDRESVVPAEGLVIPDQPGEVAPDPALTPDPASLNATIQFSTDDLSADEPQAAADSAVDPAADSASSPEDGAGPDDDYDHLFGATQFRSIEDAALAEPEEDEAGVAPAASSDADSAAPAQSLIETVPPEHVQVQPPTDQPAAGADLGDHDGRTISLSQLRAAMGQPGPGAAEAGGSASLPTTAAVMVHAVHCPQGHPNPPTALSCRVCGLDVPPQAHSSVPRPVLGVFRFSHGEDRFLTRPMLMGRSPKADGPVGDELPELVPLPSPRKELSGTHLEVRVEGWQVLVVDRRSTNGTTVRLPGREPVRLHPGEPFQIVPGAVVEMADEVSFTYEVAG